MKDLLLKTRRLTFKDLTDMIAKSEGSVKTILKNHLGLPKVKSRLVSISWKKVVALMCVNQCFLTIRTMRLASEYRAKGEARLKRARQSRLKIKVMMTVFFDFRGAL